MRNFISEETVFAVGASQATRVYPARSWWEERRQPHALAGCCGPPRTPMVANCNVVLAMRLELKDGNTVIKAQSNCSPSKQPRHRHDARWTEGKPTEARA